MTWVAKPLLSGRTPLKRRMPTVAPGSIRRQGVGVPLNRLLLFWGLHGTGAFLSDGGHCIARPVPLTHQVTCQHGSSASQARPAVDSDRLLPYLCLLDKRDEPGDFLQARRLHVGQRQMQVVHTSGPHEVFPQRLLRQRYQSTHALCGDLVQVRQQPGLVAREIVVVAAGLRAPGKPARHEPAEIAEHCSGARTQLTRTLHPHPSVLTHLLLPYGYYLL